MKQTFPLAITAFALSSFLLIPGCDDKTQPPAATQPSTPPLPPINAPVSARPPAGTPQVSARAEKPFRGIPDIWDLLAPDSRPETGAFTPDQITKANKTFADNAIGRPARFTVKTAVIERARVGLYKGFMYIKANEPKDITPISLYLYFETADEATEKDLLYRRPGSIITVEGIVTRCDIAKADTVLCVDLRSCKLVSPETQPSTPSTKPK